MQAVFYVYGCWIISLTILQINNLLLNQNVGVLLYTFIYVIFEILIVNVTLQFLFLIFTTCSAILRFKKIAVYYCNKS